MAITYTKNGSYMPPLPAGEGTSFYGPHGASSTTLSLADGDLAVALMFWPGGTAERLALEVTTAAADATPRLGVYDINKDLVLEAGTIDASSTGVKQITISQEWDARSFFCVALGENATCSVRAVIGQPLGMPSEFTSSVRAGLRATGVATGSLPASLPSLSKIDEGVRVMGRTP